MSGASEYVDIIGLERVQDRIRALAQTDFGQLADDVGALVVSQTQRRVHAEKTAPDGTPWPAWSDRYKKTRHANQSLLESEGNLVTSIQHLVHGSDVEVGSNLGYAATHQYGDEDRGIKQRQYLGLSEDNSAELLQFIEDTVAALLAGDRTEVPS